MESLSGPNFAIRIAKMTALKSISEQLFSKHCTKENIHEIC